MNKPDIFKFDDALYYSKEGLDSIVQVVRGGNYSSLVIVVTQSEEIKRISILLLTMRSDRMKHYGRGLRS